MTDHINAAAAEAFARLAGDGNITIGASGPGLLPTEVTLTADMAPKFREMAKRLRVEQKRIDAGDPVAAAYQQDQATRKGAPMVASEKTRLSAVVDPKGIYPVPADSRFREFEYIDGDDIERIAERLQAEYPEQFDLLDKFIVRFRWKKEGPKTAGKEVGGECKKASPHDRYLLGKRVDFFITLFADTNRTATNDGIESLVLHELLHMGESDKGAPAVVPHEFEGFRFEIEQRGAWNYGLQRAADGFQARMDLRADDAEDGE